MNKVFSIPFDPSKQTVLQQRLEEKGFTFSYPAHTIFQARDSTVCCTLYTSGKLVIQGKGAQDFVEFFLEPEILGAFGLTTSVPNAEQDLRPRIGSDESGKGDFFGPLCIATVYAPNEDVLTKLHQTTIKDSKTLKDSEIRKLAKHIKSLCFYDVMVLFPETYNRLYERFKNLNVLLAWAHASLIAKLAPDPLDEVFAIVDQFASSKGLLENMVQRRSAIPLIQRTKAESDIVVAAASILARDAFVAAMEKLENTYQIQLPKGAGVAAKNTGTKIFREKGADTLSKLAKVHFKTFTEIVSEEHP
ncbi:ribonuclease HIII [Chlamydiifrater phoenicopteri]|uniref:ribonuclease HIII n=1 Tax=Chlamydiifrater phoenicopteri TaxID=2681469 RepID=UPI001BD0B601|nr:ribonuclease HIII [Chlamydiifrater phoenicopteri]